MTKKTKKNHKRQVLAHMAASGGWEGGSMGHPRVAGPGLAPLSAVSTMCTKHKTLYFISNKTKNWPQPSNICPTCSGGGGGVQTMLTQKPP